MKRASAEQVRLKAAWAHAAREMDREMWCWFLGSGGPKLRPRKGALSTEARKMLPAFVRAGYRAMALKCHPDKKGGSAAKMITLTELKKWLEDL